ncbi:MAG: TIGR03987 family protein [Clostridiales bacterium]|jgi:uncharacterized repeat protein (TIGR03987 family)|nr:TIGR03987 family protein [Clostridiales bacterium]
MLTFAIISISCALVFYTVGVFAEKIAGSLKLWHLIMFWIGFVFDSTGTALMSRIAKEPLLESFHGITGLIAIVLMAVHAAWATITLIRGNEEGKQSFHKFSVVVWVIWLIPYLSGLIFGMLG